MKLIKLFLVSIFVLSASVAQANGEFIGPAFRVDGGECAVWAGDAWLYEGDDFFVQYSNGKTGHATFKCKMDFVSGEPVIFYSEWAADGYPVPGGPCLNTVSIEGEKGMWTAQCFGAWESGD